MVGGTGRPLNEIADEYPNTAPVNMSSKKLINLA
jgi:hypothetical protein